MGCERQQTGIPISIRGKDLEERITHLAFQSKTTVGSCHTASVSRNVWKRSDESLDGQKPSMNVKIQTTIICEGAASVSRVHQV